jgi:hypothetical protein
VGLSESVSRVPRARHLKLPKTNAETPRNKKQTSDTNLTQPKFTPINAMSKSKASDQSAKKASQKLKKKREVQIVKAPTAFPISSSAFAVAIRKKKSLEQNHEKVDKNSSDDKPSKVLDWHDTAKEIRAYGATAFVGKQKRDYEDEKYFALTRRHKKKPQTPLPILRGIKKAAAKREVKERQEAREAGIIIPKAKQETKKSSSTNRVYGPAPNIGFMKGGVFKVQKQKR